MHLEVATGIVWEGFLVFENFDHCSVVVDRVIFTIGGLMDLRDGGSGCRQGVPMLFQHYADSISLEGTWQKLDNRS